MDKTFDEAYARYLDFLVKLDKTDDIAEKNLLFRQLREQLSELENKVKNTTAALESEDSLSEDSELF